MKGIENLKKKGVDWVYPPGNSLGPSVKANRRYLDSLFFQPKLLGSVDVDTSITLFSD